MTASTADRRAVILYFSYFFLTSTAFPDSVLLYPSWPGAHSLRLPYLPYTSRHTIYHYLPDAALRSNPSTDIPLPCHIPVLPIEIILLLSFW